MSLDKEMLEALGKQMVSDLLESAQLTQLIRHGPSSIVV
jgi:hypothetical protein